MVDVDDFPTLPIVCRDTALFFGPVLPHASTARQLTRRARRGALVALDDDRLTDLAQRIAALRNG